MKEYLLTILGIMAALGSILVLTIYAMPLVGLGNGQLPAAADVGQAADAGQAAAPDVVVETGPEPSSGYAVVAGTLAALHVKGDEQVAAGHPVAELADLSTWQIETDDLTELDVINVAEGDRVVMTFDAIPGLELGGSVVRIKPIGEERLGDITYTVIVQPDE